MASPLSLLDMINIRFLKLFNLLLLLSFFFLSELHAHSIDKKEELSIRRIGIAYVEKDYSLVEKLIKSFQKTFPKSNYIDNLYLIEGDSHFAQNHFEEALKTYNSISKKELINKTLTQKLHCYYQIKDFKKLYNCISKVDSSSLTSCMKFYLAECLYENNDLDEAKEIYQNLLSSKYATPSKIALSEIYRKTNQNTKAEKLYIELSEELDEFKNYFTQEKALLQANYSKELALQTLGNILEEEKDSTALVNWSLLLFQTGQVKQLIENKILLLNNCSQEHQSFMHHLIGQSFLIEKNYKDSIHHLLLSLKRPSLSETQYHDSLLSLITASYEEKDKNSFEKGFKDFQKCFPEDPNLKKLLLMRGKLYNYYHNYTQAHAQFEYLTKLYPQSEEGKAAFLEDALALLEEGKWIESHSAFTLFCKQNPDHPLSPKAMRFAVNAQENLFSNLDMNSQQFKNVKDQLFIDIETALKTPLTLTQYERPSYINKLAQMHFENKNYKDVIDTILPILSAYQDLDSQFEAHLLLAFAYKNKNDLSNAISHLEKALSLDKKTCNYLSDLYYELYEMIKEEATETTKDIKTLQYNAAIALYQAKLHQKNIDINELNWLANIFYENPEDLDENFEKSQNIFEKILFPIDGDKLIKFSNSYLLYSDILSSKIEDEKLFSLLLEIKNTWDKEIQKKALFYSDILFKLSNSYHKKNDYKSEKFLLEKLIEKKNTASIKTLNSAKLALARLLKTPDTISKAKLLLEEVQQNRSLENEPLHLEAAIDLVELNSISETTQMQPKDLLENYKKLKKDFFHGSDIYTRSYIDLRKTDQKQADLFQKYMLFVDGCILDLQAKIENEKGNLVTARKKQKLSQEIFSKLSQESTTPYIMNKIKI